MKRLYIVDLDGTTGIYHLPKMFPGQILLRPDLRQGLDLMGDARRVIATRAAPPYLRAVRRLLDAEGITFDAYYDRETLELTGGGHQRYLKHYDRVLEEQDIGPDGQAVVIGDLMHFKQGVPYTVKQYRRFRFRRDPTLPTRKTSCCDHPTDPRILYVILPQVLTMLGKRVVTLSFRAVIAYLERLWKKGQGSWMEGFHRTRRWDWHNERMICGALMEKIAFEVQVGKTVHTRTGEDITRCFRDPRPHHYLLLKGRSKDWKPAEFIDATLEIETR